MNRKKSRCIFAILTVCMFLSSLIPLVSLAPGTAAGAGIGYSVLSVPLVDDDKVASLGTLYGEFTAGQIKKGDTVNIKLPEDFEFRGHETSPGVIDTTKPMTQSDWKLGWSGNEDNSVMTGVYYYGNGTKPDDSYYPNGFDGYNYVLVAQKKGADDPNGMYKENWTHPAYTHRKPGTNGPGDLGDGCRVPFALYQLDTDEIKIEIIDTPDPGEDVFFYLYFGAIYVDAGYSGDIKLTADSPSGSGFGSGQITIGRATEGEVTVSVTEVDTFSDSIPVTLRIKEDVAGALDADNESVKFVVPTGFAWQSIQKVTKIWGDKDAVLLDGNGNFKNNSAMEIDDDELILDLKKETNDAVCFEVTAVLEVDDETEAKTGDVVAQVRGESDLTLSELTIAKYGEYNANIKASNEPKLIAGQDEQVLGDIIITEDTEGSLIDGRTIILTLPSNAKWGEIDTDSDSGVTLKFLGFPGRDGKSAKWEVSGESNDNAELKLEDMEVVLEPGVTGDLNVEVSGTAGLSGSLKIGEIVGAVSAKAENAPDVIIGLDDQAAGDITITENIEGAIEDDKDLILDLPDGVRFAAEPKVELTNGNLDIDEDGIKLRDEGGTTDNQLVIPIDGKSTTPSSFKVTGIKYTVDRTVPQGGITLKVKGDAVNEVNDEVEIKDYYNDIRNGTTVYIDNKECFDLDKKDSKLMIWPQSNTAAKVVNATCVTPAPGEVAKGPIVFTIGEAKYTVGGATYTEQAMDVAPYIKDDRTYLPLRYVAYCLGIPESNILWNEADKTVTLIKGTMVVQVKIGSTTMLVNGATVTMDVAPEIVDPGRTMLPIRWVAERFGATVTWDETAKTVTIVP